MPSPFQRLALHRRRRLVARRLDALQARTPWGPTLSSLLSGMIEGRTDDPEEPRWSSRIEEERERLRADAYRVVTFRDFGAGDPGAERTEEAMNSGVMVTRRVAEICDSGGLSRPWRRLLFKLVRAYRPSSCLELGTSLGFSGAYQAAALEANGAGRLLSLEGALPLAEVAARVWSGLSLDSRATVRAGRFQDTLRGALEDLGEVDFALIDGHHDGTATIGYFEQILPYAADGALLVFDDILWYPKMREAWLRIASYPKVKLAVDLEVLGIVWVSDRDVEAFYETVPVRALLEAP